MCSDAIVKFLLKLRCLRLMAVEASIYGWLDSKSSWASSWASFFLFQFLSTFELNLVCVILLRSFSILSVLLLMTRNKLLTITSTSLSYLLSILLHPNTASLSLFWPTLRDPNSFAISVSSTPALLSWHCGSFSLLSSLSLSSFVVFFFFYIAFLSTLSSISVLPFQFLSESSGQSSQLVFCHLPFSRPLSSLISSWSWSQTTSCNLSSCCELAPAVFSLSASDPFKLFSCERLLPFRSSSLQGDDITPPNVLFFCLSSTSTEPPNLVSGTSCRGFTPRSSSTVSHLWPCLSGSTGASPCAQHFLQHLFLIVRVLTSLFLISPRAASIPTIISSLVSLPSFIITVSPCLAIEPPAAKTSVQSLALSDECDPTLLSSCPPGLFLASIHGDRLLLPSLASSRMLPPLPCTVSSWLPRASSSTLKLRSRGVSATSPHEPSDCYCTASLQLCCLQLSRSRHDKGHAASEWNCAAPCLHDASSSRLSHLMLHSLVLTTRFSVFLTLSFLLLPPHCSVWSFVVFFFPAGTAVRTDPSFTINIADSLCSTLVSPTT